MKTALLTLILTALMLSSCSQQTAPEVSLPSINKAKITELSDGDTQIEIYSDNTLHAGYNKLYVRCVCACNGQVLQDAHVEMQASMAMSGGTHDAPMEQPLSTAPNALGLFEGAMVCTMPSISGQDWSLNVHVHNHLTDTEHDFTVKLTVPTSSAVQKLQGGDGQEYFCVCALSASPCMGMNPLRFWIYRHSTQTQIEAMSTMNLSMSTHMTTMDMSSDGNVQPVATGDGEFAAAANLNMHGGWDIQLRLSQGGTELGVVHFPVQF